MAGLVVGEVPAGGLLTSVVPAAERGAVAFAGPAARVVGGGVVDVAAAGGAAAAEGGAGPLPGFDEVPQRGGPGVAGCLAFMGAGAGLEELEAVAEPGGPPDRRAAGAGRVPGAGAGVGDGLAAGAGEGEAPPGGRAGGEQAGEVTAGVGVDGAVAGGLAGAVVQPGVGR